MYIIRVYESWAQEVSEEQVVLREQSVAVDSDVEADC